MLFPHIYPEEHFLSEYKGNEKQKKPQSWPLLAPFKTKSAYKYIWAEEESSCIFVSLIKSMSITTK